MRDGFLLFLYIAFRNPFQLMSTADSPVRKLIETKAITTWSTTNAKLSLGVTLGLLPIAKENGWVPPGAGDNVDDYCGSLSARKLKEQ